MLKEKLLKVPLLFIIAGAILLSGCSHRPISSRDISNEERIALINPSLSYPGVLREPANWANACLTGISDFLKPKIAEPKIALPELTQLAPELKKFPNGKKYTQYVANKNVMNKYPDYEDFKQQTVEVVFEPNEYFGHINLRVGETLYSFDFIKSVTVKKFNPVLMKSSNHEMPGSTGFVFQVDKEQIKRLEKEIEAFYRSSVTHNVPPFDAYSPLLKIIETEEAFGKSLKYESTSPKFGNSAELKGEIVQEGNSFFIDTGKGIKLPLSKKGKDYYLQSYSCSSSAGYILKKFFGIKVSYDYSAKSLVQSLLEGNINESISPIAVIKYYED